MQCHSLVVPKIYKQNQLVSETIRQPIPPSLTTEPCYALGGQDAPSVASNLSSGLGDA